MYGENLYTIAFRYTEPKKARDVVQAALSTFIEQSLGESRSGADSARKFLDEQIRDYDQKLKEAEGRVNAFKLKYMGLFPTAGKDFVTQHGRRVSEQIKDARLELRVAEQTRDGIKQQLKDQHGESAEALAATPSAAPRITVPELDGRIEAAKRQIDELLRNYTEQHPDVVGNRRLIARLEEERAREVELRRKAAAERPDVLPSGDPVTEQLKVALNEAEAQRHPGARPGRRIRGPVRSAQGERRIVAEDRHRVDAAQPRLRDPEEAVRESRRPAAKPRA